MKNAEYLNNLRHSTAHLLAAAVVELYPGVKPTIGPAIQDGFYYDFDFPEAISDKDLKKIDQKMREIIKNWGSFQRLEATEKEALDLFSSNEFKTELIKDIVNSGAKITLYKSGNFTDLCRGGHIANPKESIKYFKLMSTAGAYWRGSEKNKMLTRIYGIAFDSQDKLNDHLSMLAEAKKRDHKKLGKELDLFVFSELVGPGLPLWTPKGTLLRELLDDYVWSLRKAKGYEKVEIPHITKKELYERSGHWSKFSNELFKITTREGHEFAMKPMNCPHHTQIYARRKWSFRDLPQRYANTTMCYRDEQTGELSGLSRVRSFTQDDAHVFTQLKDVKQEFMNIWEIIEEFYGSFGFDLKIRLSLHDPVKFENYLGDPKIWAEAENTLRKIVNEKNAVATEAVGEAAFYGPKIDFMANDSLGREWQVATIQLDMNMPRSFDLNCTNEKGEEEQIYMIHAAIMGSLERFISIIIEHFAGNFPVWLSPVQVVVIPIADRHRVFAEEVAESLKDSGIRVNVNSKSESMQKKIRNSQKQKINYMLIIGDQEIQSKLVNVRLRNGETATMSQDDFKNKILDEVKQKK
ncbi:threonine--tRNA ligase [Candidatus Roizmanbacteria bacterium CG_4_10_14_0_2_um_filter_36_9]|uniref:Threonine--tRNA ligase n=2 Tax=Candidatus Roizmaniibacteriota TaxID=1752723 RepID=A0A2M7U588_9BACT|nr:MAG: threonine--tRNA ligase [Candidatus Roizmanbacteria bacterium CG_4_10_14_0_2_um_filter_36_9]